MVCGCEEKHPFHVSFLQPDVSAIYSVIQSFSALIEMMTCQPTILYSPRVTYLWIVKNGHISHTCEYFNQKDRFRSPEIIAFR